MKKVPKSRIVSKHELLCDLQCIEDLEGEIWKDIVT